MVESDCSEGTDRFIRFTSQTIGSSGSIPVRSLSGPMLRIILEPWSVGPVRFLKPWLLENLKENVIEKKNRESRRKEKIKEKKKYI